MIKEYDLQEKTDNGKTTTFVYYYEDKVMVRSDVYKFVDIANGIDKVVTPLRSGYTKVLGLFESTENAKKAISTIDESASTDMSSGFIFEGITFSTSDKAQDTLNSLPHWSEDMFPCKWVGKNNEDYTLTFANRDAFYKAFILKLRNNKNDSGILKTQ